MQIPSSSVAQIVELEARQEAALRELEALEQRLEQVLAEQVRALASMAPLAEPAHDRAA
jgi:predicted Zn-dependent peptidase